MSTSIIIVICVLILLSYIFDIKSSKIKVPSVILLLALGWLVKQATVFFEIRIPDLQPALPILGTIGLILIVLEGSLELELNKKKLPFVIKSFFIAFLAIILFSFGLGYAFHIVGGIPLKSALSNAIPLGVISSAIAIPSAQNLIARNKEFITYESSLSDIIGVVFFNFIAMNEVIGLVSIGNFFINMFIILVISFIATLGLSYLLSKITHSVKFTPIIIMLILIYVISKTYHLPALLFIMLFGLFLANIDKFKRYKHIQKLEPDILSDEVHKFRELTAEMAFLIRSLFFLLFGFLVETSELLNTNSILWSIGICGLIYAIRFLLLKIFRIPLQPLLFIAPRGLITILLFLSIPTNASSDLVNNSLIIQVIILTSLIMMAGLMPGKKKPQKTKSKPEEKKPDINQEDEIKIPTIEVNGLEIPEKDTF